MTRLFPIGAGVDWLCCYNTTAFIKLRQASPPTVWPVSRTCKLGDGARWGYVLWVDGFIGYYSPGVRETTAS